MILFKMVSAGLTRRQRFADDCKSGSSIWMPAQFSGAALAIKSKADTNRPGDTVIFINPAGEPYPGMHTDRYPKLAHAFGMQVFLYVTLFDEGWPLLPKKARKLSYHNKMHCQHVSWQSSFSRNNPEYIMTDRTLKKRQWGVMCLAYPEVRQGYPGRRF